MTSIDYPHTGAGWAFPVRWEHRIEGSGQSTTAVVADGLDKVMQSMELVIRTQIGERRMRPDFGSGAQEFVFESLTSPALHQLANQTERALKLFEPRILLDRVEAVPDPELGRVDLVVEFRVDRHRRPTSLVVPFYTQTGLDS